MKIFWRSKRTLLMAGTALGLVITLVVVGNLGWPAPDSSGGNGWQVTHIPTSLWLLLLTSSLVCVGAGATLTLTARAVRWVGILRVGWLIVALAAAGALVWNNLYLSMLSGPGSSTGPIIPIFDWAFTAIPAVLGGAVAVHRGALASATAGLGTAVVTLPLYALGSALLLTDDTVAGALLRGAWNTLFFGIVPLGLALAVVAVLASSLQGSTSRKPDAI